MYRLKKNSFFKFRQSAVQIWVENSSALRKNKVNSDVFFINYLGLNPGSKAGSKINVKAESGPKKIISDPQHC